MAGRALALLGEFVRFDVMFVLDTSDSTRAASGADINENGVVASVMGGYEGHRGWINYLAVKPSEQRKGYGQAIMRAVETLLRRKGCPKINLQVRTGNEAVIAFYSAMGYGIDNVVGLGKRLEYD